jgi:hypothetical protein
MKKNRPGIPRLSAQCWLGLAILALVCGPTLAATTNKPPSKIKMPAPAPRRPNLVLILADSLGYGDLGCYGQTLIKTPRLDQLAAQGIRFTSFYTGSPEDAPARAAWMTGLEPVRLRTGFNQALPPESLTVAAFLKSHGYHTGLIGTWGLGDTGASTPDKYGFDEFAGFLSLAHARDYFTPRLWRHDPVTGFDGQIEFAENEGGRHERFMPDLLTTAAVNFIHGNKPEPLNHHRPFFLCVAYPLVVTIPNLASAAHPRYANDSWPPLPRIRASLVSRLDDGVGQILDALERERLSTNTVVIFASVNGPLRETGIPPEFFKSAGPLRGGQGSVYEGGLRVPLLVRWPGCIPPGRTSDQPCAAWDFLPTAAELALTRPPEKLDGISLLPVLLGKKPARVHEEFHWKSVENDPAQAARVGDWKGVRTNTTAALELYQIHQDPAERNNVAAKHPDQVRLVQRLLGTPTRP